MSILSASPYADARHNRDIMKITSTVDDSIVILEIEGSLSAEAKLAFDREIDEYAERSLHCILDLSRVTFIDSTAIGSIVRYYSIYRKNGRHFVIGGINKQIYEVFNMTGITGQMSIYDSPTHAINFIRGS
jgi:anti-sigma B factor antagonist